MKRRTALKLLTIGATVHLGTVVKALEKEQNSTVRLKKIVIYGRDPKSINGFRVLSVLLISNDGSIFFDYINMRTDIEPHHWTDLGYKDFDMNYIKARYSQYGGMQDEVPTNVPKIAKLVSRIAKTYREVTGVR